MTRPQVCFEAFRESSLFFAHHMWGSPWCVRCLAVDIGSWQESGHGYRESQKRNFGFPTHQELCRTSIPQDMRLEFYRSQCVTTRKRRGNVSQPNLEHDFCTVLSVQLGAIFCEYNADPLLRNAETTAKNAAVATTRRRRDSLICRQNRRRKGARTVEQDRRIRNRFNILLRGHFLFSRQITACKGDRNGFPAQRFEGVLTSPLIAEA